nr:MAG TPA: hypothetical protein [Caudoviricetes sp.]
MRGFISIKFFFRFINKFASFSAILFALSKNLQAFLLTLSS